MTTAVPSFDVPSSLQEYAIPEQEFLDKTHNVHILCTGAIVFNGAGKLLLVQRAKEEKAFPNTWEIPGGKMEDTDETILHAAARELKEETGLVATRVVRKVAQFTFSDGPTKTWLKLIFQFEVDSLEAVVLDPNEHQSFAWVSEDEVMNDMVNEGKTILNYISQQNKDIKLGAFRLQREANMLDQS